jgi:hypothetical protein
MSSNIGNTCRKNLRVAYIWRTAENRKIKAYIVVKLRGMVHINTKLLRQKIRKDTEEVYSSHGLL